MYPFFHLFVIHGKEKHKGGEWKNGNKGALTLFGPFPRIS